MDLKIGISAQSTITVDETNTAKTIGSGSLDVFATPAMLALIEKAAVKCVEKYMSEGQTTVGTLVNIAHVKASPIGETITAVATLTEIDGRKLTFNVEASDSKGLIGKGCHERFVVDIQKFMGKLK